MFYENSFKFTLIASLVIHSFLLYQLPHLDTSRLNKTLQQIEVNYYKLQMLKLSSEDTKMTVAKPPVKQEQILVKKEILPKPATKEAPPFFKDDAAFLKKIQPSPKNPLALKQLPSQKKISLPELKSENKIKNPKYNNYYQIVRDKIRRQAYDNYLHYETGEVYLVFVILKDGSLKDARIIDEKCEAGNYLKKVAITSIKEAAPYPAFPEGLSYPELSFNVVISFEISN